VIPQLRSELLKQRSTRTTAGLFAAMLALTAVVSGASAGECTAATVSDSQSTRWAITAGPLKPRWRTRRDAGPPLPNG
jgi:hypothetical protein